MNEIEDISQQLMKLIGIVIYILGCIGNLLNICVFTIWCRSKRSSNKYSRLSNSPLYLLVSSLSNLIVIIYPLLTRILVDGYGYQITQSNLFILCQFRYFILHLFDCTSLSYICLAIFDRYLISSREARLRKLIPTKTRTKLNILFVFCFFFLHSIPLLIYYNLSPRGYCIINSPQYLYYYFYIFQILLHSIIPIIFLSIFVILLFKQLQINHRRKDYSRIIEHDKQISRMILLISLAIIFSSIPYCIEQSYYVLFNGNNRQQKSYFFLYHVVCSILFYTNPVSSFYIYYISTRNFRKQVHQIICWKSSIHYAIFYQIKPITTPGHEPIS